MGEKKNPTSEDVKESPEGEIDEAAIAEAEAETNDGANAPKTIEDANALIAKLTAALSEANAESKKRKTSLRQVRAELDELKAAREAESNSAKAKESTADKEKIKALESELDSIRRSFAIESAARDLGFQNPKDAIALGNFADVEFDPDSGTFEGIEDALSELLKARPYLKKTEAKTEKAEPRADGARRSDKQNKGETEVAIKRRFGIN